MGQASQRARTVSSAERMAATVNDIVPDLMMVASGIIETEWDEGLDNGDQTGSAPLSGRPSTACASGSPGYQPKDATEFVKDLIARLAGLR